MIKAVLFDIDGVLIDSFEANLQFLQNLMSKTGYTPPTREEFVRVFPMHLREAVKTLTQATSQEEINRVVEIGRSRETGYDLKLLTVAPEAKEVLEALAENYKLGVVTSRETAYEAPALAKLADKFQVTVAYNATENHKPHPEPLLLAAQRLGVKPAECIYIGDAPRDLEAGRAAGMKVIIYSKHKSDEADGWTDSFGALSSIVLSLSENG